MSRNVFHAHEITDGRPKWVVIAGVLVVLVVAFSIALPSFFPGGGRRNIAPAPDERSPSREQALVPPDPRIDSRPNVALRQMRRQQLERLSGYRWADRSAGVVQIPIERAMTLVSKRDLPLWEPLTMDLDRAPPRAVVQGTPPRRPAPGDLRPRDRVGVGEPLKTETLERDHDD